MHAKNPHLCVAQRDFRHDRAARLQTGQVQYVMHAYVGFLAHQNGVAVPAHRICLYIERHRLVGTGGLQQPRRYGR